MSWISVEDRLPEKELLDYYKDDYSKSVICSNSNTGQVYEKAVRYSFKYKGWVDYDFSEGFRPCDFELLHITHWMPLPEPPKEV